MALVGCGDKQAVGELRPAGLGDELVHVTLADAVRRRVRLGLDRPQHAVTVLSDQVDAGVYAPPTRPVVPEPHPPQQRLIRRIVLQEPLADVLELLSPPPIIVGVEFRPEIAERPHATETRGDGIAVCLESGSHLRRGARRGISDRTAWSPPPRQPQRPSPRRRLADTPDEAWDESKIEVQQLSNCHRPSMKVQIRGSEALAGAVYSQACASCREAASTSRRWPAASSASLERGFGVAVVAMSALPGASAVVVAVSALSEGEQLVSATVTAAIHSADLMFCPLYSKSREGYASYSVHRSTDPLGAGFAAPASRAVMLGE